jgi:hypothetical protein
MFRNQHFDKARQIFADQFVNDGNGYIYRKSSKGAPVRVTEAERDEFVANFSRWLKYTSWGLLVSMLAVIAGLFLAGADLDKASGQTAMYASMGLLIAIFLGAYFWAWSMPVRALSRRATLGSPLSKNEVRALAFTKITYPQLALAAGMAVLILLRVSERYDIFHGWGIIWLMMAITLIIAAMVQAVRKWLFERSRS